MIYYTEEVHGTERSAHRNMLCHDHTQIMLIHFSSHLHNHYKYNIKFSKITCNN